MTDKEIIKSLERHKDKMTREQIKNLEKVKKKLGL